MSAFVYRGSGGAQLRQMRMTQTGQSLKVTQRLMKKLTGHSSPSMPSGLRRALGRPRVSNGPKAEGLLGLHQLSTGRKAANR